MAKPRIALIGLGAVGELHLSSYQSLDNIEIVAIAEPNVARRGLVRDTSIATFSDHRELLLDCHPDIACVLTPAASHEQVVLECAAAGVHVLCEKPMALSLASALRMRNACREKKVRFWYGASYRHLPAVAKARELIRSGVLGRIRLMREEVLGGRGETQWQALPEHHYPRNGPGGSGLGLMDHGIHLIDIFRWFTGQEVSRVVGRGNISGLPPLTEYVSMDFEGGTCGLLVYDDATFPSVLPGAGIFAEGAGWDITGGFVPAGGWSAAPGSIEVHGSEGTLRIFHYANALFLFNSEGVRRIPLSGRPSPAHFATQLEAFVRSVTDESVEAVTAEDGIRALCVALAAYTSHTENRTVQLSYEHTAL